MNAIFDKSPIPHGTGREDTGTYQPTIDHVSGSVHEKYPEPASCPDFALCLTCEGGDCVPTGKYRLERETGVACTIRSPTDPWASPQLVSPRVAYMPGDGATGKGNIYNLTGNVQSGSHSGDVVGKMCKKGRLVNFGFPYPGSYRSSRL
jgi:hypothetical protein